MDWLTDPQAWIAFFTLVLLELVLGVDNVIFITILAGVLPEDQRPRARTVGLGMAVLSRILLLFSISWIIGLTAPLFMVFEFEISGRDIILILGGLFLLAKSTYEIHQRLEGIAGHASVGASRSFVGVIVQILLLDAVFSLDSVITAVGMANELTIMIAAVVIAAGVMIVVAGPPVNLIRNATTVVELEMGSRSTHRSRDEDMDTA